MEMQRWSWARRPVGSRCMTSRSKEPCIMGPLRLTARKSNEAIGGCESMMEPSKKRALFIINSLAGGGAERVMSTLLSSSGSEREEFEIALVLLDVEKSAYEIPDWIDVHQLDSRRSLLRSATSLLR